MLAVRSIQYKAKSSWRSSAGKLIYLYDSSRLLGSLWSRCGSLEANNLSIKATTLFLAASTPRHPLSPDGGRHLDLRQYRSKSYVTPLRKKSGDRMQLPHLPSSYLRSVSGPSNSHPPDNPLLGIVLRWRIPTSERWQMSPLLRRGISLLVRGRSFSTFGTRIPQTS